LVHCCLLLMLLGVTLQLEKLVKACSISSSCSHSAAIQGGGRSIAEPGTWQCHS
jgi:hypothetical protein